MSIEIKVPTLPESVADALIVTWHKKPGDPVSRDEVLVDIETDKVVLEVPAAENGVMGEIIHDEGATVIALQLIGHMEKGDAPAAAASAGSATPPPVADDATNDNGQTSPSVRRLLTEHGLDAASVKGTGKNGRITSEDVERHVANQTSAVTASAAVAGGAAAATASSVASGVTSGATPPVAPVFGDEDRPDRRVPMTRLRSRIAERLLEATQTTAMLTTFNEVDMQAFMELRAKLKDDFLKAHGIKLGFMSIFLKAATEALKRFPDVNASIDGDDIVYHGYSDIGVAVSSERGLVVPVLRNTEFMSLAEMESTLANFAEQAREGKLSLDDMTGGTFTISNGGVFGSLLSTPILNPPQSAILGMHSIQQRPVVVDGEIVIRPMMYLALSYDHRIVDGKGAVTFLTTIKELIEDPAKMLFDI